MARRSRRHRRRGARRLRRFRRSGRSFGRRRYSRSFRYSRRRSSRSRKRYRFGYHGKYKKSFAVTSNFLPPGYMRRTYNFFFTSLHVSQANGFPPTIPDTSIYDGSWLPANFLDLSFDHLDDTGQYSFQNFWTSPLNMYSVSNLTPNYARSIGYKTYTVIRLDWLGLLRCQFSGFFPEVSKQIMEDFQKYGYWRPGRITVKLIPKYGKPPSFQMAPAGYTFQSSAPLYRTGAVQLTWPAASLFQSGTPIPGGTTNQISGSTENGAWTIIPASKVNVSGNSLNLPQLTAQAASSINGTIATSSDMIMYTNRLAQRIVGYLIPSGYDTVTNTGESTAYAQMYKSVFSSASQYPRTEWTSSFRNVGFKRQILSSRRSCKFSYKYSRYIGKVGVPGLGLTTEYGGVPYVQNPTVVVTRSYSANTNTPYASIHDAARLTWIRGDYMKFGVWRKEDAAHPDLNDEARLPAVVYIPQYQPLDYCNVFIPGIDVADLFNMYNVRFSYTCKFSSRVFDNE